MSNQPSLASLLQQDISVITVKDLRYEGKLYSYDTANFTITLQNVRSMGTEQRVTATQVPARKEVFEYIVFNANHIKSFQPIIKTDTVLDPAIIATMGESNRTEAPRSGRGSPKKSSAFRTNIMKMLDDGSQRVRTVDMNRLMGQSDSSRSSNKHGQRGQSNNVGEVLMGQLTRNNSKDGNRGGNRKQNQRGATGGNQKNKKQNHSSSPSKGARHVSFKTDLSNQDGQNSERRQFTHIPQIPRSVLNREGRRNAGQDNRAQSSPRRQRSGSVPGKFPPRKTPVKFEEEFDFDKALEEFKELSINEKSKDKTDAKDKKADGESREGAAGNSKEPSGSGNAGGEPSEPAYNQDKSFYDNLTTTTEAEGRQRPSRREIMMTNKETFGVSYLPWRRFNGRSGSFQGFSNGAQNANRGNNQRPSQANARKQKQRSFRRSFRRMLGVY